MRPFTESELASHWQNPLRMLPFVVGRLVAAANPIKIILFGSHARGDARTDSDLDLLVVVDHSDNLRESAVQLQGVLSGTAIPADIIVATPAVLEKYRDFVGYVYRAALLEGVTVYERR